MPRLKAGLLGLALLIGSALARPALADAAADAAALALVEQSLASLDAAKADFVQDLIDRDGKVTDHAIGTLSLKKPGRFRWDYSEPKQLIVSDGETLWLYDPELEQATVRKVKDTLSQTPAMLLAGTAKVTDGFNVSALPADGGLTWVRLIPKKDDADFKEIRLAFAGGVLKRLEFADKLNQLTRVELVKLERNAKFPDSLFKFVAPPGVDVIGPKH